MLGCPRSVLYSTGIAASSERAQRAVDAMVRESRQSKQRQELSGWGSARSTRSNAQGEVARSADPVRPRRTVRLVLAGWACIAGLTAITGPALAQTQRDVPAVLEPNEAVLFSAGVDVVNVTAAVQDLDNRFVTDLGKDDFVLYEDGVPQEIRYFGRHTDVSMNLGLLVDTSGSQVLLLEEQRNAGALFFRSLLRPDSDRAFAMKFDSEVALLQDFTSSVEKLEAGLALMAPPASQGVRRSGRRIRPTSTALYDAVYLAGDE